MWFGDGKFSVVSIISATARQIWWCSADADVVVAKNKMHSRENVLELQLN